MRNSEGRGGNRGDEGKEGRVDGWITVTVMVLVMAVRFVRCGEIVFACCETRQTSCNLLPKCLCMSVFARFLIPFELNFSFIFAHIIFFPFS